MKSELALRKSIMRRVWGVYLMRRLAAPVSRLVAFLAICLVVASSVSVPNVVYNTLHATNSISYLIMALVGTKIGVQAGVLAAGLIALWSAVDIVRAPHARPVS